MQNQSFSYGEYWTKKIEDSFLKDSSKDVIVGFNILGEEPMQQKSEDMLKLVKRLKEETKIIGIKYFKIIQYRSITPDH